MIAAKPRPHLHKDRKKRVTFSLHAPEAQSVLVTGSFCDWQTQSITLKKDKTGVWKKALWLSPGCYEYRFFVDGEWRDDPECRERVPNPFGTENCVLHVLRNVSHGERSKIGSEDLP